MLISTVSLHTESSKTRMLSPVCCKSHLLHSLAIGFGIEKIDPSLLNGNGGQNSARYHRHGKFLIYTLGYFSGSLSGSLH